MRDIAVTLAVFGSLPFILRWPWFGIIVWTWLGFMNPHRMAWGFSRSMPFAEIVAITTLVALLFSTEQKRIPWTRETITLALFTVWMAITTLFALYGLLAWEQLEKVAKIQFMIFVAMLLITTRERLQVLVATIACSLAFYGVKGGIFTILHGGVHRVQGPPGTFIGGNNEIGLALAMTIPLFYYLARQAKQKWLRLSIYGATVLSAIAAIGTQSRGALVGMAGMGVFFWLKGKQKIVTALLIVISAYAVIQLMPEKWYARMRTIETYQEDKSVSGRINAWHMAFNMAVDRPLGGGFESFLEPSFAMYAPEPRSVHDAHSIYFEVLGEHGFVGLGLFMLLGVFTWFSASAVRKQAEKLGGMEWLSELCRMVQVSMIAYATAGAFLGMAYFDYYYNLVLIVVMSKVILLRERAGRGTSAKSAMAGVPMMQPPGVGIPGR